jgi:hypothetical protein
MEKQKTHNSIPFQTRVTRQRIIQPLDRYNDPIGLCIILHPQDFIKNQSESLNFSEDIQQTLQLA